MKSKARSKVIAWSLQAAALPLLLLIPTVFQHWGSNPKVWMGLMSIPWILAICGMIWSTLLDASEARPSGCLLSIHIVILLVVMETFATPGCTVILSALAKEEAAHK